MGNLKIKNVFKSFNIDNVEYPVLSNIEFEVSKGEILCILGSSGSGKSTLLRMIGGFDVPSSGEIILKGKEINSPVRDRIMVFQDLDQLFPWKTVLDNILLPLKINNIGNSKKEREDIAYKYLNLVQLNGYEKHYPHQLSGGMKQRAAIARSLALEPEVLLMDEPFGSLDAQTRNNLQKLLLSIWTQMGTTILFVTHDIHEAIYLSSRILVLNKSSKSIGEIIDNKIPRPRLPSHPAVGEMWGKIYDLI